MIASASVLLRLGILRVRLAGLRLLAGSWRQATGDVPRGTGDAGSPSEIGRSVPAPGDIVAAAYESFQREIHSFAVHATRDPDVAADITHECFLKLLREVQQARTPDNIRAWLYRVASNLILNRARHIRVAEAARRAWSGGEGAEDSPEWLALRAERTAELRTALGGLSRDAQVGLLLAANGFSGREIAATLGRTELATRTLLCRARADLRDRLAGSAVSP